MKRLIAILVFTLTMTAVQIGAAADSSDDELEGLSAKLFENTNTLVNLSKDLAEIAKTCEGNEMVYLFSLGEKIGDILVICFYEARLLETSKMIKPDSRHLFFEKTKDGLERRAIGGIRNNLSAIEAGSARIQNTAAIHVLDTAKQTVRDCLDMLHRCVEILQRLINKDSAIEGETP